MKKRGRRPVVGVLLGDGCSEYADKLRKGIRACAEEENVDVVYFTRIERPPLAREDETVIDFYGYQYDEAYQLAGRGHFSAFLVAMGSLMPYLGESGKKKLLQSFGETPYVLLEEEDKNTPALVAENYDGMRQNVEHLIKVHGYRKIGYVGGHQNSTSGKERERAFLDVMRENGLTVGSSLLAEGDFTEFVDQKVEQLLQENEGLEAIVFANDEMAKAGYRTAEKHGLIVGRDIAITGFDDCAMAKRMEPPLTTVSQHIYDLGYRGLSYAVRLLDGKKLPNYRGMTELVRRCSCGCQTKHKKFNTEGSMDFEERMMACAGELANRILCSQENKELARHSSYWMKVLFGLIYQEIYIDGKTEMDRSSITGILSHLLEEGQVEPSVFLEHFKAFIWQLYAEMDDSIKKTSLISVFSIIWEYMENKNVVKEEEKKDRFHLESWFIPLFIHDMLSLEGKNLFYHICLRMQEIGISGAELFLFKEKPASCIKTEKQAFWIERMGCYDSAGIRSQDQQEILPENCDYQFMLNSGEERKELVFFSIFFGRKQYGFMVCELKESLLPLFYILSQQIGVLLSLQENAKEGKQEKKELLSDLNRFKERTIFALEYSTDIIFEYEEKTDCYQASNSIFRMEKDEKQMIKILKFQEWLKGHSFVNKKLLQQILRFEKEAMMGETIHYSRINCSDRQDGKERKVWVEVEGKAIFDPVSGKTVSVIGKLRNVTAEVVQEQVLRERYLRDHVTNLYNYLYGREVIDGKLIRNPGRGSVFILVICNFSYICDSYGSAYGNALLSNFARVLEDTCGRETVLMRLRGPVFAGYYPGEEISLMMGQVRERVSCVYVGEREDSRFEVKTSIRRIQNGDNFDNLYSFVREDINKWSPVKEYEKGFPKKREDVLNTDAVDYRMIKRGHGFISQTIKLLEESRDARSAIFLSLDQAGRFFHLDRILAVSYVQGQENACLDFQWTSKDIYQIDHMKEKKLLGTEVSFAMLEEGEAFGNIFLEKADATYAWGSTEKLIMGELCSILSGYMERLRLKSEYQKKNLFVSDLSRRICEKISENQAAKEQEEPYQELFSMAESITEYTELDSGNLVRKERGYGPASLLHEISRLMIPEFRKQDRFLMVDIDPMLPKTLFGDEYRIRQIILNFLHDAMERDKQGDIEISLSFELSGNGIQLLFEVKGMMLSCMGKDREGFSMKLEIARKLVHFLEGEAIDKTEDGQSVYYQVSIPQKVLDSSACIEVHGRKKKKLLFYSDVLAEKQVVRRCCLRLGVAYEEVKEKPKIETGCYFLDNRNGQKWRQGEPLDALMISMFLNEELELDVPLEVTGENEEENLAICEQLSHLPGIDVEEALHYVGTRKLYVQVVKDYLSMIEEKAALIENYEQKGDLESYQIEVHGIKSAARMAGVFAFSKKAEYLEFCAKQKKAEEIRKETPFFLSAYRNQKIVLGQIFANMVEKKQG